MTKFFCPQFVLELSHLPITLIEENARFHKSNLRNYSLPFSFDLDDETSKKLGFIDDFQSRKRSVKHYGKLQFLNRYENAILYLFSTGKRKVQAKIDFGGGTLPLLETNLKDLPFELAKVPNISMHARDVVTQNWPQVRYNFPRIIDRMFSEKHSKHEEFQGFINNQDGNRYFILNNIQTVEGKPVVFNRNAVSPCVYMMEVLKVGFGFANISMHGDFINDLANRRVLIYSGKCLENFQENGVNTFLNEFVLTDFLPDVTFGTFLNRLRNWFNLEITFRKNMVTINYLERRFKNTEFQSAIHLENDQVSIEFNKVLAYQLIYDETTKMAVDASGNPAFVTSLDREEIQDINMDMTLLRIGELDDIETAEVLEGDADFKVLLYNGLQENRNLSVSSVYERNFTLPQIYDLFWKSWIQFRLNSSTFTDKYETENDDLDIDGGIWKYQNKHLIKKITRKISHINDLENVDMTVETESLF